jgi:hypothetical protein
VLILSDPVDTPQIQHPRKRRQLSTAAAIFLHPRLPECHATGQRADGLRVGLELGKGLQDAGVEQFDVPMSDTNEGSTSLADLKKNGMSYNLEIRGKKVSGYCKVNGKGKISEFKQGI